MAPWFHPPKKVTCASTQKSLSHYFTTTSHGPLKPIFLEVFMVNNLVLGGQNIFFAPSLWTPSKKPMVFFDLRSNISAHDTIFSSRESNLWILGGWDFIAEVLQLPIRVPVFSFLVLGGIRNHPIRKGYEKGGSYMSAKTKFWSPWRKQPFFLGLQKDHTFQPPFIRSIPNYSGFLDNISLDFIHFFFRESQNLTSGPNVLFPRWPQGLLYMATLREDPAKRC